LFGCRRNRNRENHQGLFQSAFGFGWVNAGMARAPRITALPTGLIAVMLWTLFAVRHHRGRIGLHGLRADWRCPQEQRKRQHKGCKSLHDDRRPQRIGRRINSSAIAARPRGSAPIAKLSNHQVMQSTCSQLHSCAYRPLQTENPAPSFSPKSLGQAERIPPQNAPRALLYVGQANTPHQSSK
jgi:hypothetical protein